MLTLVWVFTLYIYLSWHFLLCLQRSGCSQYRFIYIDTFCYAYIDLGVHNADIFIMALSAMLVLVWMWKILVLEYYNFISQGLQNVLMMIDIA